MWREMDGPVFAPVLSKILRYGAEIGQEKRESVVTRLPLFEPCFRVIGGKDSSGSSLGGRPWKIVLIRRLPPWRRPTHICGQACHRGIGHGLRRLRTACGPCPCRR